MGSEDVCPLIVLETHVVPEMMRSRPKPGVAAFLDSIVDEGLGLAIVTRNTGEVSNTGTVDSWTAETR